MPLDVSKDKFCRKVLTNLNEAAFTCDTRNLKILVNCGNKINDKLSIFGEAPIHKAVLSHKPENSETLKAIIENEADIETMDSNGWSALHHACYKGDFNSTLILLNSGANVNSFSNFKKTPLHLAALNNNYECLKLLIEKEAFIECLTDEDSTPLHLAAKKGNLECL
jgi:ankyrin repeat protein